MRSGRHAETERTKPAARRRRENDGGVAVVEFAIIAPVLVLLLFGIIEAGWAFAQQLEVRHGAREGARLAAVNEGSLDDIVAATCAQMDLSTSGATVSLAKSGPAVGDSARVEVAAPVDSITGLTGLVFGTTLTESVEMRIEQPPTWVDGTRPCP
ncbi:MAG: pilus assembly protein [Acidimicrobiia bacterium]|nr:pilus assembly protein [Acidimicrobiia bacterium]